MDLYNQLFVQTSNSTNIFIQQVKDYLQMITDHVLTHARMILQHTSSFVKHKMIEAMNTHKLSHHKVAY